MYLARIQLSNVRCFWGDDALTDLDLERPNGLFQGWTVFAGRNGSGKSTLLRAIALAIAGPEFARQLQPSFKGWVREGEDKSRITVHIKRTDGDALQGTGKVPHKPFPATLFWTIDPQSPNGEPILSVQPERQKKLLGPWRGPWGENPQGWFVTGYGPFRRLTGHAADAQRLMVGPHHVRRLVSLFREDASLVEAVEWLQAVRFRAYERREGAQELLSGVLGLLNNGLLPDGAAVQKVDSEGMWVKRGTSTVRLLELSDGYRVAVGLILDIIRGLAECFGGVDFEKRGKAWIVKNPGIVMIDEVDAHLHIAWQQRIGFWLKERFPHIQFLVTTHSPFICQAADPGGIIRLPVPGEFAGAEHVDEQTFKKVVNGSVSEAVLSKLFGLERTRSERAEQMRLEFSKLRARQMMEGVGANEERRLRELKDQLPLKGPNLPGIDLPE